MAKIQIRVKPKPGVKITLPTKTKITSNPDVKVTGPTEVKIKVKLKPEKKERKYLV